MKIFYNGTVYTGSGFARVFAVADGRLVVVGDEALEGERLDLGGAFVCAGSENSREEALAQLALLRTDRDFEGEKLAKYNAALRRTSLDIPDRRFRTIFDWIKIHTTWLILRRLHLAPHQYARRLG